MLVGGAALAWWWWHYRPVGAPETGITEVIAPAGESGGSPETLTRPSGTRAERGSPSPGRVTEQDGSPAALGREPGAVPRPQAEAAALKRDAVAVAVAVAQAYPDDALSHALLGSATYNTGQSEEATRHLRRCLELNPDQADAYEILARVAYEKGQLEESIRLGEEALRRGGANPDVLNQLGRAQMDLGRTDEARTALEQAVRLPRPLTESYYLLGQVQLQSGDPAAAKASFQEAVSLLPDHTQAYFGLFTACQRLGQSAEAIRYRERFLELEAVDRQTLTDRSAREDVLTGLPLVRKTVARTLFGAAQIYGLHGQAAKAAEFTFKAALLDDEAPLYRATLEAMVVRRNAAAEGVRLFEQLALAQPENGLNHLFLGRLHERLEAFGGVERSYRRVQELAPESPEGYRALAEFYLNHNREAAQALSLARQATELDPSAPHYYLLAVACSRNRDRAGAIEAIERAVALRPGEARYGTFLEQLKGGP